MQDISMQSDFAKRTKICNHQKHLQSIKKHAILKSVFSVTNPTIDQLFPLAYNSAATINRFITNTWILDTYFINFPCFIFHIAFIAFDC